MSSHDDVGNKLLSALVRDLQAALGQRMRSVILYGSAARGDVQARSDLNVLVVMEPLDPESLEKAAPALRRWTRGGQPMPRLFSPALIADSADVFPIEMLDIRGSRRVLHGDDPFAALVIHPDHLRMQCERELREKLMRLREGYVEAHDSSKGLERLLVASYTTFVALFRGCLHLMAGAVPARGDEVVAAFCDRAGLDPTPFQRVDRLRRGEARGADPRELFLGYHEQLMKAVARVDRFAPQTGGGE